MPPHSLVMTMIGASLLWVGWFGFNAGSNLEATGGAPLAMINSFVATAAAALSWMFAEWIFKGKPSLLGVAVGLRSRVWSPSRRRPASPDRWARSCSASSSAWSACSSSPR